MKQTTFEHPTGVLLHVQYIPATAAQPMQMHDVRVAETGTYEPVGPNLAGFLHNLYTADIAPDGDSAVLTPVLQQIAEEIANGTATD